LGNKKKNKSLQPAQFEQVSWQGLFTPLVPSVFLSSYSGTATPVCFAAGTQDKFPLPSPG
jgi:hypothetical protein